MTNWPELLLFLGLFTLAETKPVRLGEYGSPRTISFTVTFIIAVVAIIKTPPSAVGLLSCLSVLIALLSDRKFDRQKALFNAAQVALAGSAGALVYRALGGTSVVGGSTLGRLIVLTTVATAAYTVVNSAAVSGAIALSTHSSFLKTWIRSYSWTATTYVAFGPSGIVLASLYQLVGVVALPLLFVPLLVARGAFRSYQEVSDAYLSTVRAFVQAIEAKDAYTRGHSERVAGFARMIAERMGVKDQDLEVFYFGALLHDVGKLVVRKAVLTKPARLEEAEFDEIKKHPVIGAQIVNEIEFLRPAIDAVLSHHERLDGSGYPAGLAGDLVSSQARIMAVADTYDAMTSTRAYRGARTRLEAVEELKRLSGSMYDPRCVQAFLDGIEEAVPREERKPAYEAETVAPAT